MHYSVDYSVVEYVWIGGNNVLRSKSRVFPDGVLDVSDLPKWNFDGSSTGQASGEDSEVIIVPRKLYKCPFRDGKNYLVMCDTYTPDDKPLSNNHRQWASTIFENPKVEEQIPWFGMEQEYFLINPETDRPLGFLKYSDPEKQGKYYCSAGHGRAFGRKVVEQHLKYCLIAGIKMSGINAEVAPGQWEFQIGPCIGINEGDDLWMARYIMERVTEEHNLIVNWEPKPENGDWNGSGCHTNYSTLNMRKEITDNKTGLDYINEAIKKLSHKHKEHMNIYGSGNELRMTGLHETADYNKFSWGTANRGASIRIGNENMKNKYGYFEDRRPSSNCDPYLVTAKLCETTLINK
jgi:glutamine synthetase